MITILIIRAPKISPLFYNLLELHSSSDYCKLGEDFDHYLHNLYFDMKADKSKSGIFVTNHNLNLPKHVHSLRAFAEVNRVKFIIIK